LLHEGVFAPWLSRVAIHKDEVTAKSSTTICHQCENAKCAAACPQQALVHNSDGVLVVDATLCDGCMLCVAACPFAAMHFNEVKRLAFKCDLCGGEPQCPTVCPAHVLLVEVRE
jgi:Fe-S-cluster-containing hydrogenase component 2